MNLSPESRKALEKDLTKLDILEGYIAAKVESCALPNSYPELRQLAKRQKTAIRNLLEGKGPGFSISELSYHHGIMAAAHLQNLAFAAAEAKKRPADQQDERLNELGFVLHEIKNEAFKTAMACQDIEDAVRPDVRGAGAARPGGEWKR